MVAATKKGRPEKFSKMVYAAWDSKEKRTAQNLIYAGELILLIGQKPGDFFVTEKGNLRRQGIAEQIGRMLFEGYPEEECKKIAETAIELYKKGFTVKALEKWIRTGRKTGNW